jgi:hypothetical protein
VTLGKDSEQGATQCTRRGGSFSFTLNCKILDWVNTVMDGGQGERAKFRTARGLSFQADLLWKDRDNENRIYSLV